MSASIAVFAGSRTAEYIAIMQREAPDLRIFAGDAPHDAASIDYLVGWRLPPGALAPYTNLKALLALGAGVDALLRRDDLPPALPIAKLADAGMAPQMVEYALMGVLTWQRRLCEYSQLQAKAEWKALPPRLRADTRVSVLGLGAIGGEVARELAAFGYRVAGWSRSRKSIAHVRCLTGADALVPLLAETDVLVNMLPSTVETVNLLDNARLSALPQGAYVVNGSRGDQLDSIALVALIDSGHLSGALLDVFEVEPLPAESPLWRNANIRITPHAAANTLPDGAIAQVIANIRRVERGEALANKVERGRGY